MTHNKPELHDVWEHDGKTMRKFQINDQVVPTGKPLTRESSSWGPRNRKPPEEVEFFTISNSVKKKIFGSTFWFHELCGWKKEGDDYIPIGNYGHYNAANLRKADSIEQKELR
jgi:hypothetical protein